MPPEYRSLWLVVIYFLVLCAKQRPRKESRASYNYCGVLFIYLLIYLFIYLFFECIYLLHFQVTLRHLMMDTFLYKINNIHHWFTNLMRYIFLCVKGFELKASLWAIPRCTCLPSNLKFIMLAVDLS